MAHEGPLHSAELEPTDIVAVDEVAPLRFPRRRVEEAEMDITPMIDVTFLLLIFFIVASKMDPQKAIDLPSAQHGLPVAAKSAATLIVAKGSGDDVIIYKGASKDPQNRVTGELAAQDEQIEQFVADQIHGAPPKRNVLIMAEKGIHYRHVDRVARAASRVMEDELLYVAVLEEG